MQKLSKREKMMINLMQKVPGNKKSYRYLKNLYLNYNDSSEKVHEFFDLYEKAAKLNKLELGMVGWEYKSDKELLHDLKKHNRDIDGFFIKKKKLLGGNTKPYYSIPVEPNVSNMINNNLKSANPPPNAIYHYPGTNRLGNNTMSMPGINKYIGTTINPGPFNIKCTGQNKHNGGGFVGINSGDNQGTFYSKIICPGSGFSYNTNSKKGLNIIKNYLLNLNK